MGYFSRPGDFKKWFIAYHKEQTNEERWRGLQITYTQAPEDTGRWKRGGALMAFQQSAKHSLEYRQCHLPEVRYVTDVYLRSPGGCGSQLLCLTLRTLLQRLEGECCLARLPKNHGDQETAIFESLNRGPGFVSSSRDHFTGASRPVGGRMGC